MHLGVLIVEHRASEQLFNQVLFVSTSLFLLEESSLAFIVSHTGLFSPLKQHVKFIAFHYSCVVHNGHVVQLHSGVAVVRYKLTHRLDQGCLVDVLLQTRSGCASLYIILYHALVLV